jgi:hypothetical protein
MCFGLNRTQYYTKNFHYTELLSETLMKYKQYNLRILTSSLHTTFHLPAVDGLVDRQGRMTLAVCIKPNAEKYPSVDKFRSNCGSIFFPNNWQNCAAISSVFTAVIQYITFPMS